MTRKSKRSSAPATTPRYIIGGDSEKLLPINKNHLVKINPKTQNQLKTFEAYDEGYNLVLKGSAGVGKSFLATYLALRDVFDTSTPYDKLVIVRSTVPTRNQGFLPGNLQEKEAAYELPYKGIVRELVVSSITGDIYEKLKAQKSLEFISTSYVRGITIDNAIILVDELENLTFHEASSIITRIGKNCKIIFCGDTRQSDLSQNDKFEHKKFLEVLNIMKEFSTVTFGIDDIVRSSLVKNFLIAQDKLGY
jgi:predicted ribonuclease YlaK